MKIVKFTFNMFGVNTYVVWDPETLQCMIVDPGMITEAENQALDDFIAQHRLKVKYLVNTHMHLDHIFGNAHVADTYGVNPLAHPADHALGRQLKGQARMFGIPDSGLRVHEKVKPLVPGDVLTLGHEKIEVLHVPGHSPGGLALYAPHDGWVIVGDSIFAGGGMGRTDLPGGDYGQLINAIGTQLFTLPPQTRVFSGHGPASTIGAERR